jgi:hypothetical protein
MQLALAAPFLTKAVAWVAACAPGAATTGRPTTARNTLPPATGLPPASGALADAGVVAEWPITPAVLGQPAASTQPEQHGAPARYVGLPGMSAPCKALAEGLSVRSQHTVCRLHHSVAGWQLETVEHGLLPDLFSQVLLAVPAPQAATLLADSQPRWPPWQQRSPCCLAGR